MSTPAGDDLVGDATIRVDGDTDPAMRALQQFSRDTQGRLRDLRGRFASESQAINRQLANNPPVLDVDTGPATDAIDEFTRDAQGRLRDVRGRFIRAGEDISRGLTTAASGGDQFGDTLGSITRIAGRAAGAIGMAAGAIGALGAAAGSAVPLLAGIVSTLESIAPAGAVAVSAMLAVQQASAAVRLGMVGVEEAVTAAFDTSKEGAKAFQESLEKLSPSARAFAKQVRELAPVFREFQQSIQEELFTELDSVLDKVAKATLPVLQSNLTTTASTMGGMAASAGLAAAALAKNGTLGKALEGANEGLRNLAGVPAQVVTALGKLGVAAAPAFDRITTAAAKAATKITGKLSASFKTGELEKSINRAVGVLRDLGRVAENVFAVFGNVMAPVQDAGGSFVDVLLKITGALRRATAKDVFQDAMHALAEVMGTLARTVGPLLGQALAAIGPVFTALGPPLEVLINALGDALSPVITALGPVLTAASVAVGALVRAVSPLLPVVGELVASLLPAVTPLFDALTSVFVGLQPVISSIATVLQQALAPILAQLPALVQPFADLISTLASAVFPVLADLVAALAPALVQIGASFGELLAAVAPLLEVLGRLIGEILVAMVPLLQPIIATVGQLASIFADQFASLVTNVLVPALQLVTNLLRGDFSAAWESLKGLLTGVLRHFANIGRGVLSAVKAIVTGVIDYFVQLFNTLIGNSIVPDLINGIVRLFASLPGRALSAISSLAGSLAGLIRNAGSRMLSALRTGISNLLGVLRGLPGRARSALGNIGSLLYSAGRALIQGFIGGIKAMAGALVSAAKDVVGGAIAGAKSLLGISSPSKVFAEIGRDTGRGFIKGLTSTQSQIKATSERVIGSITKAFRGRNTRVDDVLVSLVERGNKRLQTLAKERDKIAKQIEAAQKFAAGITSQAAATGSLGSIVSADFAAPKLVKQQMRDALAQIKAFTANVQKLAKKGVNKDLLRQILELGPEQGAAFAQALAGANKATIKQFNSLNKQISGASSKLGKTGADLLFDSGKKAGEGFLTGLKAQQKKIEQLMLDIAKGMQKAIRKALGIKSPSRVMAALGQMTVLGLSGGITATAPAVDRAMARVADAVTSGVPALLAPPRALPRLDVGSTRATSAAAPAKVNITVKLDNHGVIGSRIEVENWLARALDQIARTGRLPAALRTA
jgi:phage-related protein